jgi:hypothetical protein
MILNKVSDKSKMLNFDTESEQNEFEQSLLNHNVLEKFIESAFNGNVLYLPPLDVEKA